MTLSSEGFYKIVDSRTGERATVAAFLSRESAESQIKAWQERDRLSVERLDCHDQVPFLEVKRI